MYMMSETVFAKVLTFNSRRAIDLASRRRRTDRRRRRRTDGGVDELYCKKDLWSY